MTEPSPTIRRVLPVLLTLAGTIFVSGTAEYVVAGLLPQLSADLDVSIAQAGQLVTGYALAVFLGGPIVTVATTRLPRKGLMLSLVALFVAGAAISATAGSYQHLMVGRVVSGLAHATLFAAALSTGAAAAPRNRRGTAIAIMASGLTLAIVAGAPLGTAIGQAAGWRVTFAGIAVAGIIALLPLALLVNRKPVPETSVRDELSGFAGGWIWLILSVTVLALA
ncbi:MAG: MFS transporter, partial [Stackebrandtia sp.]